MPRRYRVIQRPGITRPWVVEGESLVDPDAWVDIQRFADPSDATAYIDAVTGRQQDQEEAWQ